jgi:hypothetical protein
MKYFNEDSMKLKNEKNILNEENLYKNVKLSLQLLKTTGFDLTKLNDFNFSKFKFTKNNNLLEKYLKLKIKEMVDEENRNKNIATGTGVNLLDKNVFKLWEEIKLLNKNTKL